MSANLIILFHIVLILPLQAKTYREMERKIIQTKVGSIAVFYKQAHSEKTPIIFLHGVYFDHHLWDNQVSTITDRPVIAVDMPLHGESKTNIKKDWNLDDCAGMLIEILDSLNIKKVIAVGHSWGSMTILRAAHKNPDRFSAVGLCNMPFERPGKREIRNIQLQHLAWIFRKLYMEQAAKALMGKGSLSQNPELKGKLMTSMGTLTGREIKYTDKAVRMDAGDTTSLIESLNVPALAMVGREDYVGIPPTIETALVEGGHVSPLEVPNEVNALIESLFALAEKK